MSNQTTESEDDACDVSHVADVEDGCGCVEVWEHLSEQRATADD